MPGVGNFVAVIVPAVAIGTIVVLAFCFLRRKYPQFFYPRLASDPSLLRLSPTFFSWTKELISISEETVLKTAGLDAVVYLKFLKFAASLAAFCTVFGIGILLPVNFTGGRNPTDPSLDDFEKLTLANIPLGSSRYWAHWVVMYLYSGAAYYFLFVTYRQIFSLAQHFVKLQATSSDPSKYTCLVSGVPQTAKEEAALAEYFQRCYPTRVVHSTALCRDYADLQSTFDDYVKNLKKLKSTEASLENEKAALIADGKSPEEQQGGCCKKSWAEKQAALEELRKTVNDLRQKIVEQRGAAPVVSAAFVHFRSLAAASQAAQTRHASSPSEWLVSLAPEARDMYWPNLSMPLTQRTVRSAIVTCIVSALVIFWVFPTAFVASLGNLEALSNTSGLGWLSSITDLDPTVKALLQGLLPTVLLAVLMALLPPFLRLMAKVQGVTSLSGIDYSLFSRYFMFLVVNVFLVTTLSGSVFNSLSSIVDDPKSITSLLGKAIPTGGTFFIQYVAYNAFFLFSMELSRLVPFIVSRIMLKLAVTDFERREAEAPGSFAVGSQYPNDLLMFVLMMSYAAIAPLILPFGCIYFAYGYFVIKHQLLYVYKPVYETAGAAWPYMFRYALVGLFIGQLTLIGVIALNEGAVQAPLMLPLPFITVIFYIVMNNSFGSALSSGGVLPLEAAVEGDEIVKKEGRPLAVQYMYPPYQPACMYRDLDKVLEEEDVAGMRSKLVQQDSEAWSKFADDVKADGQGGLDGDNLLHGAATQIVTAVSSENLLSHPAADNGAADPANDV